MKEMIERELARKEKYEKEMKERFYRFLKAQNIEIVKDNGYSFLLKYNNKEFGLLSNRDWNSWTKHYQVWIVENSKTLATRCGLELAIAKAKKYIDEVK